MRGSTPFRRASDGRDGWSLPPRPSSARLPIDLAGGSTLFIRRAGFTPCRGAGFTLVEVVVVLAILAAVASVVVLRGSSVHEDARSDVTRVQLSRLREATTAYRDDVGALPTMLADLFVRPPSIPAFDPLAGKGWNGPYVSPASGTYSVVDASGFTTAYGAAGSPAWVDGWKHAVVLQLPTTPGLGKKALEDRARLVSAGPDGSIQTSPGTDAPNPLDPLQVGDDLVLYLYGPPGP